MIQFGTLEDLYRVSSTRMIETTRNDDKGLENKVDNEHENCTEDGLRFEETPVQRLVENQENTIDGELHGGKDEQKIVDNKVFVADIHTELHVHDYHQKDETVEELESNKKGIVGDSYLDEPWKFIRSKSNKNYRSRSKNISFFSYNKSENTWKC